MDTAASPASAPKSRLTYALCGYTLFVLFMGTNMPSPLYRSYQRIFGFSPLVLTLVFSVYVASLIPSLLLFGPLSDVVGRRRVLFPALALAALGAALFAAADSVGWLFAARLVQGVAMALGSGAITAAMVEAQPDGDPARAAVAATGCIVVGAGAGPLLAGVLAEYAPGPRTLPYLVELVALVPAAYGVSRLARPVTRGRWRPRRPRLPATIRGPFLTASASSWLAWAVTALFLTLVPSYALALASTANLAVGGAVVALLFGCSAVAQVVLPSPDDVAAQRQGLALLVVGLVVLVAAGETRQLALLLLATVLAGVGQGRAFLGAMRQVNRITPADGQADITSSFYLATYVGTGVPVIGVGILATRLAVLPAVEIFAASLAGLCLAATVRLTIIGHHAATAAAPAARSPRHL